MHTQVMMLSVFPLTIQRTVLSVPTTLCKRGPVPSGPQLLYAIRTVVLFEWEALGHLILLLSDQLLIQLLLSKLLPLQKRFPSLCGTSWGHSCCSAYPDSGSVQNPWKQLFLACYLVF